MKSKFILSTLVLGLLAITSCKKTGDFTTDKTTYAQGDVITVTNTTEKASEFYKWDFGGVEVIAENPIYELPESTPVGTFTISVLPVNNLNTTDNWKRSSRSVTITEAEKAKVIFFLPQPYINGGSSNETCTITFTTDDGTSSKTVSVAPGTPNCDSNNNLDAATFDNLPAGTYDYVLSGSSSSGSYTLSSSVTLEDGFDCRLLDISKL